MKLIVGLGNPGIKYLNTRHNAGFLVVSDFANRNDSQKFTYAFESDISGNFYQEIKYFLCKPSTFMNNSGQAVKQIIDYYKIEIKNILLIYDEINIPTGKYKLSLNSGFGGHNGVKNVISELNSNDFLKLKIGIGSENRQNKIIGDYVLEQFSDDEMKLIESNYLIFDTIIKKFIEGRSLDKLMSDYN